jgi:tRNA/rRNA methyltransferase
LSGETTPARPPAVILVEPQLGENIGAVARAMLNCGLTELRLVNPRDGWPSEPARANAAGADIVIDGVTLFDRVEDAIADLRLVYATTARRRDMVKPILPPETAAERLFAAGAQQLRAGMLFGRERSGLTNDEVVLADAAVTFPLNPAFTSLNLAQAVLLMGWEWRRQVEAGVAEELIPAQSPWAERSHLLQFFQHLEGELDKTSFFFPPEKKIHMLRNLRNIFERTKLTEQEIRTLHGVVRSLTRNAG